MTPVSALAIEVIDPAARPERIALYVSHLNAAMERYDIVTPARQAAFLAQVAHESWHFSRVREVLDYSTPERVVQVFRKFDLDRDGAADPDEIELARRFLHKPEALANFAYANRMGNGDEASGDGWRHIARGLIGITGRSMYVACSTSLYGDPAVLLSNPERLEQPRDAAFSAAWYFWSHGCNELADDEEFRLITKRIVGGFTGYNERCELWSTAKQVLV